MRIRTIATAMVVAAPLLALGSPQAAACWGYGYKSTTAVTPVAPRRYGYMSYGYSSPAYYGGYYGGIRRVGYRGVGWRRGYYGYEAGRRRWPRRRWPRGCWPRRRRQGWAG